MQITLETNKGAITIELAEKEAPKTVQNFVKLAQSGFYDGTKFHRVIKGFMIQGGDPQSKDDALANKWGTGGPGYTFEDEIHAKNKNEVGTIAMANSGPNTNGSQFFINTAPNDFLDAKHTVFGKVVAGMDAVRAIEESETDDDDRPVEPMIIKRVASSCS
jgi:peptidylprolyl isomerase